MNSTAVLATAWRNPVLREALFASDVGILDSLETICKVGLPEEEALQLSKSIFSGYTTLMNQDGNREKARQEIDFASIYDTLNHSDRQLLANLLTEIRVRMQSSTKKRDQGVTLLNPEHKTKLEKSAATRAAFFKHAKRLTMGGQIVAGLACIVGLAASLTMRNMSYDHTLAAKVVGNAFWFGFFGIVGSVVVKGATLAAEYLLSKPQIKVAKDNALQSECREAIFDWLIKPDRFAIEVHSFSRRLTPKLAA
jgi:hypothetical protein